LRRLNQSSYSSSPILPPPADHCRIQYWEREDAAIKAIVDCDDEDEDEDDREDKKYEDEGEDEDDDDPARGNADLGRRLAQQAQKFEHVLSLREAVADQEKYDRVYLQNYMTDCRAQITDRKG
jgi:hypothetical protein